MIIAVTGSIGSGKSHAARILAELMGAEHCDTDQVCRDLMAKDHAGWQQVAGTWGPRFLNDDGAIDRATLREAVFTDDRVREALEAILHPLVRACLDEKIARCRKAGSTLVVEIPLLFETGWQDHFDVVITVSAPRSQCIDRVMKRDGVSREQAVKALDVQMDIGEKARRAHYVIDNAGTPEETHQQVAALQVELQGKADQGKEGLFPAKTLDS